MLARLEPLLEFPRYNIHNADTFICAYTVDVLAGVC